MRFILLKTLTHINCTRTARELRSFFFDPSVSLGIPAPENTLHFAAPFAPVRVVIIGGGPAGLTAAIKLAELVRDGRRLQIDIYEKRWTNEVHGTFKFAYWPADQRRRDQVITLQNHVLDLLSSDCRSILFPIEQGGPENVWPDSCNLQIQKVEDALQVP